MPQPFATNGSVAAFYVSVPLGFVGRDIFELHVTFFNPCRELATDVFRSAVYTNGLGFAAPFNDLVQRRQNTTRSAGSEKLTSMARPSGPVAFWCCSNCSFMRPFARRPIGFSSQGLCASTTMSFRWFVWADDCGKPDNLSSAVSRSFYILILEYVRFSQRFSSVMSFISDINDASIPPNFARHS